MISFYDHSLMYSHNVRRLFDKSLENINMKIQYNIKIQILWTKIIFIFQYNLPWACCTWSNEAQAFHTFYIIRFIFLFKIAIYNINTITSISSQISFHLADSSDYAWIFPNKLWNDYSISFLIIQVTYLE